MPKKLDRSKLKTFASTSQDPAPEKLPGRMVVHPDLAPFFRPIDTPQEDDSKEGPDDEQKIQLTGIGEELEGDWDIDAEDAENGQWLKRIPPDMPEDAEFGEDPPEPAQTSSKARALRAVRGDQ